MLGNINALTSVRLGEWEKIIIRKLKSDDIKKRRRRRRQKDAWSLTVSLRWIYWKNVILFIIIFFFHFLARRTKKRVNESLQVEMRSNKEAHIRCGHRHLSNEMKHTKEFEHFPVHLMLLSLNGISFGRCVCRPEPFFF